MIYVDPLREYGGSKSFQWMRSCHLFGDTLDELIEFALSIGMRREWLQQSRNGTYHFDLTPIRRLDALKHGASTDYKTYLRKQ
jgi:hypothetical protein